MDSDKDVVSEVSLSGTLRLEVDEGIVLRVREYFEGVGFEFNGDQCIYDLRKDPGRTLPVGAYTERLNSPTVISAAGSHSRFFTEVLGYYEREVLGGS